MAEVYYLDEETHDERGLYRAHDTASGKQIHGEDIGKMYAEIGPLLAGEEYKQHKAAWKAFLEPTYPPYYVNGRRPKN